MLPGCCFVIAFVVQFNVEDEQGVVLLIYILCAYSEIVMPNSDPSIYISPPQLPSPYSHQKTNANMGSAPDYIFRLATLEDAEPLAKMINTSFRADKTTQVFLSTDRPDSEVTTAAVLTEKILQPDCACIVVTSPTTGILLAHGGVRKLDETTGWFGMLAVHVDYQKQGLGDRVLKYAEEYAVKKWGVTRMEFNVVNTREDLRAWYGKRGYSVTGETTPFPYEYHGAWEGVFRPDLHFVNYGKNLSR